VTFQTAGAPPATVGGLVPGGQPFDAYLIPNTQWGGKPSGTLAIPDAAAAGYAGQTLNSFVHGASHSDLRVPFRLSAWLTNDARLVMHLNSVSSGAIMVVRADGAELFRTNLPNLDGGSSVTNEYNMDIPVNLPPGNRLIEITNAGGDWFYLDWVRLERVLPAFYQRNWQPSPEGIGLRGPRESLVYLVAPRTSFPMSATNSSLPLQQGQTVTLTQWPSGRFFAEWYDPATGRGLGTNQGIATNTTLTLTLPDYREDLAGIIYPPPSLSVLGNLRLLDNTF
jgi:hypothetical protein